MPRGARSGVLVFLAAAASATSPARGDGLRFELSFPVSARSEVADGRVLVILSKTASPEPRLQTRGYDSAPFFAEDVEGLRPGQWAVIDERSDGYPIERLSTLPTGDYFVQGLLNLYTTFRREDGHVVKMHMDQWEGQSLQRSSGNLISEPRQIHIDPRRGATIRLTLDRVIPPIDVPADTAHVKHIRYESPLLTKFWGRPILIGATILLPKDYEKDSTVSYPVLYEQGHFSTAPPGDFGEKSEVRPDASEREKEQARRREEFTKAWLSDDFPRMLYVTFQHPTPYYDDSYAVDSPNVGPYGEAITRELIPTIEAHFRAIQRPWARILSGGSTGGWESLALQIFHPDFFGGTFSYCPDPVDFHYFQIVNIYEWPNAWYHERGGIRVDLPGERGTDDLPRSTMEQQLKYERALGTHGRSGEQWDIWQAVYGPLGADGYFQPLFDPKTGSIDKTVADSWREHADLNVYLRKHWPEIGSALAGKLHIWVGDMDSFYLNDAVHLFEDSAARLTHPGWGGSVVYGPRQPHCWSGQETPAERWRQIAAYVAAAAPPDAADAGQWRRRK